MFVKNTCPYLACGSFYENGVYVFLTPKGAVEVGGVDEIINCILPHCDGTNELNDVIANVCKNTQFSMEEINDVLEHLFRLGILVDKNSIFTTSMKYSQNPMIFFQNISKEDVESLLRSENSSDGFSKKVRNNFQRKTRFMDLLEQRCSTRDFSQSPILEDDLFGLFWSAYGIQQNRSKRWKYGYEKTYTVPSGGAIFPLVIYFLCLKDYNSLNKGLYRWDNNNSFLWLEYQCDIDDVLMTIDGIETFDNATGVMIVCADFDRASAKYANKAYPLVLLEAGHVMQNAYLYSAERNIGFVEVLGFCHDELHERLKINKTLQPIVVGVIGGKR